VHLAAALDHQPRHAVGAQILTDPAHLHRLTIVDHGRNASELREGIADTWTRAVNGRLGLAGGEVVGAPVQLHPLGHGDLDRRRRSPRAVRSSRRISKRTSSRGLSLRTVAAPIRIPSHEARMASTPVEVGVTGQLQTPRRYRDSGRSTRHSSTTCTSGHACAVRSRRRDRVRPVGRLRRNHATTRTAVPGRLATSTITP
jgi:hypothetical protein